MATELLERQLGAEAMPPDDSRLAVVSFDMPQGTAEIIQTLDKPVADFVRHTLGNYAVKLHEGAMESMKSQGKAEVPDGIVWPSLVGQETIWLMMQARKQGGGSLEKHDDDPNLRLIVRR